jgi:hypothetical protein
VAGQASHAARGAHEAGFIIAEWPSWAEEAWRVGFASWLLSNVLGILLVIILALFLFGVFSVYVFPYIGSGLDNRVMTLGPCLAAGIVASLLGGTITMRMRRWLETE